MTTDSDTKILAGIGVILLIPITFFLNVYLQVKLWGWFFVPIFHFNYLTFWQMFGVSMVVTSFTQKYKKSTPDEKTDWSGLVSYSVLAPLFALGVGYLVHLWI